jgi:hypothetical protein
VEVPRSGYGDEMDVAGVAHPVCTQAGLQDAVTILLNAAAP